jgi:hypothetical protein
MSDLLKLPGWILFAVLGTALLAAQEDKAAAPPPPDARPLLTKLGKVLYSENLAKEPVNPQSHMGKWEVKDGVLTGSEREEDHHGASLYRTRLAYHDAALQVSFRIDGAKKVSLFMINGGSHVVAVGITAASMQLTRSLTGGDKSETLDTLPLKLQAGRWYALLLETQGKDVVASIDGGQAVFGAHEKIDVDENTVRLGVGGESAAFKDFCIREATASDTWPTIKAKLLEARKAAK